MCIELIISISSLAMENYSDIRAKLANIWTGSRQVSTLSRSDPPFPHLTGELRHFGFMKQTLKSIAADILSEPI